MGQVQDVNAGSGARMAFLSNFKVQRATAKLADTTGKPLGVNTVFQQQPRAFTTNVPATLTKGTGTNLSAVIYGDFSQLFVALRGDGVDVLVNPFDSTTYLKGNVQVRTLCNCDVELRHPEAFAVIKDAIA